MNLVPGGVLMIAGGLLALAGGIWNWDAFMTHWRARLVVRLFGREGARVFYASIGVLLLVLAPLLMLCHPK